MIPVADADDPRVADYRRLADPDAIRRAGLFIAEGRLVVRRLLASDRFRTRSVLVTDVAFRALRDFLERASSRVPVFVVDHTLISRIAGFNFHRGCLAVAERPAAASLASLPMTSVDRLIVLERVSNPDNVGGIFRTAAALGVDAAVLGPACGDPLYRKSVRTSMGATLTLPFAEAGAWPDAIGVLRAHGLRVLALTPDPQARPLNAIARTMPRVALLVGAEGEGLSAEALAASDERVRIPMEGHADSLNVTVAASIAMYHFSVR
jgi:tRNA G18 (ribose-2'-O)-methylase SpoU